MKGSECRLIEYMEGSKKRFIIPVYQRNYDWKTENCKQLYDDLIKVIKTIEEAISLAAWFLFMSHQEEIRSFL